MIDVLYDGSSSFLARSTRVVKRFDRKRRLHFTNSSDRKFDARIFNKSSVELKQEIHAIMPDGRWVKGADALREMWAAVGFGPLVMATRFPLICQLTNLGYHCMAAMFSRTSERPKDNSGNSSLESAA